MDFWKKEIKEVVESYPSISVFEMNKSMAGLDRHPASQVKLGDTWLEFAQDGDGDYLKLVKAPQGTSMTAINFAYTPCNYGGRREWFECNKCQRPVGILYRTKDYEFHCRHCLDLRYQSQKRNYRGFGPILHRFLMKYQKMEPIWGRQVYQGKITKRAERWWKFRQKVEWEVEAVIKFNKW